MLEKQYGKNEVIFREGDYGDRFYQIESGRVGVFAHYGEADERKVAEIGPGEYFGEMAVIEAYPRSATVVALEDVKALEITEESLNRYFRAQPDKIMALMKVLSSRLRDQTKEYQEVLETLDELGKTKKEERSESLLQRIRKFVDFYQNSHKDVFARSVESQREAQRPAGESDFKLELETYAPSTIIFREGEIGKCMYSVQKGVVGIYAGYGTREETKLSEVTADHFFGEMGMIENEPRSATAVAEEDGTCVEIIRPGELAELFEKNPFEVDMILRHLSARLRKTTRDYVEACGKVCEAS